MIGHRKLDRDLTGGRVARTRSPKYCNRVQQSQRSVRREQRRPFVKLDLTNGWILTFPKTDIDAVVLLASQINPANVADDDPRRYIEVNVTGTLNVLEYCRITKAKKIIFASSHSNVARLWGSGRPITEASPRGIIYGAIMPST